MFDMQAAEKALSNLLVGVRPVDDSVIRGEKRFGEQTYAVAYVDLADAVVERSQHLREFQERILGDDFFDTPGDLRWNKYLYIVAGPNSQANPDFAAAKAAIEADKDYARKRVVYESELESLLGGAQLFKAATADQSYDVLADWERRLAANRLDLLLDCPTPRTGAVDRIGRNDAGRAADGQVATKQLHASDEHIATSRLRSLKISNFRPIHDGKTYEFGNVTLIVGANGAGKTSLLEAVEYLYCGGNRRSNLTSQIRMKAWMSQRGRNDTYEVTQTVDAARKKARLLAWYNRNERSVDAIVSSFSLYNFLDTDAAYRLAGTLEPGGVATELSRLLVGPTAATTFDYFEKIRADIDKTSDKAERRVEMLAEDLLTAERRLKELQERPSSAKTLLDSYRAAMAQVGWLRVSSEPLPQASERQGLLAALGHVQALVGAGEAARTLQDIEHRSTELAAAVEAAAPFAEQLAGLAEEQAELVAQIEKHNTNIGLLDRWVTYETSGFNGVRRQLPVARAATQRLTGRLGNLVAATIPEISPRFSALPYPTAIAEATEDLAKLVRRVAEARELLKAHDQAASSRATTAAKLKEAAFSALQTSDTPNACPVCRTVHASGKLLQLIEELTAQASASPELAKLTASLRALEAEATEAKLALAPLEFCALVAKSLSLGVELTPVQVLEELKNLRNQAAEAQATLQQITEQGKELGQLGYSDIENDLIWNQISSLMSATPTPGVATLDTAAAAEVGRVEAQAAESKRKTLTECRQRLDAVAKSIDSICKSVTTDGWNAKAIETAAALRTTRDEFVSVSNHVEQLRSYLPVATNERLSEISVRLTEIASAFNQAEVASTSEVASSVEQRGLPAKIEASKRDLKKSRDEAQAYLKAIATLDDIFANASLETATADALASIGGQINEVFTRIHAPHEYEYVGSHDVLLRTANSKEPRTLEQVSTGQRAAFALSIFLARNRTATSAPPVLLIDDPIAHIDDLNALSFLDYLRDLAVNSGRQIFFATADTRIASLFSKKFSFMGDAFKTINLLRAPSAGGQATTA